MDWACWRDANHEITTTKFGWPQCVVCLAAPPYHERYQYVPDDFTVDLYVPREGVASVRSGSAVVGRRHNDDAEYVHLYYEGWLYGPAHYRDLPPHRLWEAGVQHATERMITAYPTSAHMMTKAENLHHIGTYCPKQQYIEVHDEEALDAWLK